MESPLGTRLVQRYLRTSLRGRTRLTLWLARRYDVLQSVPVKIADWPTVYMDLRRHEAHSWFGGSPWAESPREVGEQQLLHRVVRAGDVAFDIGANIGLHTALLSSLVGPRGRVLSFEPNPDLSVLLGQTVREAGNCELRTVALSDRRGGSILFVPEDHSMASLSIGAASRRGPAQQRMCVQELLDDVMSSEGLPRPDVLKCDVEGAELMVFRGARRTLDDPLAPVMLFEANEAAARGFGHGRWDALDFLAGLRAAAFSFYVVGEDGAIGPVDRSIPRMVTVLAVPVARRDRLDLRVSPQVDRGTRLR